MSFFWVKYGCNIVSPLKQRNLSIDTSSYPSTPYHMYLLVYPSLSSPRHQKFFNRPARPISVGIDYVTPDGLVVPRALGEAALLGRTAVLVGGLLVGVWPQS